MTLIIRKIETRLKKALDRGKSILLLGPRQTGKTTLVKRLNADLYINLARPATRQAYEKDPARLTREVEAMPHQFPMVVIDEIQKVTPLLDAVQDLIDSKTAQFILTGSSARKLRREGEANLLPGRVVVLRMDPLLIDEMTNLNLSIEEMLLYGSLPQVILEKSIDHREEDLFSYVTTYLEEEIRSEALVRNISAFGNFLKLAALESGCISNFHKLSQDIGVSTPTISEYYQILVDCLVAERVEALSHSHTRKRLIKAPKFLIYDLGVRRTAAGEGRDFPDKYMGDLFEQWVGLELLRQLRTIPMKSALLFWRDQAGAEVDWIVEKENHYIPVEVKWTENPTSQDAKHVQTFIEEHPNCSHGYVICRASRAQKLTNNITALPWNELNQVLT
ncbi:MAG: ATP-binding protein [Chlamydiia bacterium]|nr:ATP-binding protein [Chlamydiia bacterium]MCP5492100.1 ATP-binding protein [Chlamydiales bacterium]